MITKTIYKNSVIAIYRFYDMREGYIYVAVGGGSPIIYAEYTLIKLVEWLFENTAYINKEERELISDLH
jgi:hypothetical protein